MYGAILGDIIGSPFEFDRGNKTKDFRLFSPGCNFTDDSVMTIAVAEALIEVGPNASKKEIEETLIMHIRDWGRRYPNAGYGCRFRHWLKEKEPKPYNSYGNGSAMRVSSVGWLYSTLEKTREVAIYTAEITHNHPEGIKGAEAIASCIFLGRTGARKKNIKKYIEKEFGYNLNRTLEQIRPEFHMDESCQGTVPEAIIAFLESTDFEDAIRNAVSLGGDTDTLAAITGSIAEAYYGIPEGLKVECRERVSEDILEVINSFDDILAILKTSSYAYEDMKGNEIIERGIKQLYEKKNKESFIFLVDMICFRMKIDGQVLVSFNTVGEGIFNNIDISNLKKGDIFTLDNEVRLQMSTVKKVGNDEEWLFLFTNDEEASKEKCGDVIMNRALIEMLEVAYESDKVAGLVINPFGKYISLDKEMIVRILKKYREI